MAFDIGKAFRNVAKGLGPVGAGVANWVTGEGNLQDSMKKGWDETLGNKGLGGWLGDRFKSPSRPSLRPEAFDISKESKKYADILGEQRQSNLAQNRLLASQIQQRAQAPATLANAQLRAGQDQALAQTLAAAAAARPTALNQRAILGAQGQLGQSLAEQSANAALQEQAKQQGALIQQQNRQGQTAVEDIMPAFNVAFSPETLKQQAMRAQSQADLARSLATTQQQQQIAGSVLGAIGTIGAAGSQGKGVAKDLFGPGSDKNVKKDIKTTKKPVNEFLDKLTAYEFKYKDPNQPGAAPGQRYGIMAQDLEKSEVGKSLVEDTPHGKMVNAAQGFGAVLAAQAELNRRIKKLEGRKKG